MIEQSLSPKQIARLHELGIDESKLVGCTCRIYEYQETLFEEGSPIEEFMIVTKGNAKLQYLAKDGKNLILSHYVSDGFLGDLEMMSGIETLTTTVTAGTLLEVIAIPFYANKQYLSNNITFLKCMGKELALKLLRSSNYYIASSLLPAKARLSYYILHDSYKGVFKASMKDVSASTGMSYRHMYRILNELCDEGILEKCEIGYRILDQAKLESLSVSLHHVQI